VNHHVKGAGDLQPYGLGVQPCQGTERHQSGWHGLGSIGVDCATSAGVAGVQRGQQLPDLSPAAFSYDQPVRTHAQCLADQFTEVQSPSALEVSVARFQRYNMRVNRVELCRVLYQDQTLRGMTQPEHGGEQGCLPRARGTADEETQFVRHDGPENRLNVLRKHAAFSELGEGEHFIPTDAYGQQGSCR
jgi:hypothetical protein